MKGKNDDGSIYDWSFGSCGGGRHNLIEKRSSNWIANGCGFWPSSSEEEKDVEGVVEVDKASELEKVVEEALKDLEPKVAEATRSFGEE
jgi:hypothetical protein